ncbi:hypothetical protein F8M41_007626 [Gigaspora margarita]|uniref:Uncharacterized protein n=1 Tax=Gigaspora margarita TaxID=4874 RepID=A0A8H3X4S8_GIGMA|nr:hypothetical protein F8M41_007626 [Gigaspora margarita]
MNKIVNTSYNTKKSFNSININLEKRKDNFKQSFQKLVARYEPVIDKQAQQKEIELLQNSQNEIAGYCYKKENEVGKDKSKKSKDKKENSKEKVNKDNDTINNKLEKNKNGTKKNKKMMI